MADPVPEAEAAGTPYTAWEHKVQGTFLSNPAIVTNIADWEPTGLSTSVDSFDNVKHYVLLRRCVQ